MLLDIVRRLADGQGRIANHLNQASAPAGEAHGTVHPVVDQDHGGAVGRRRVVERWVLAELVYLADVLEEQPAGGFLGHRDTVEVDVLRRVSADVGAHADQVALVGDDVDQLVAAENPLEIGRASCRERV